MTAEATAPAPTKDFWTTTWNQIDFVERCLKVARGSLFFVAAAFTAANKLSRRAVLANRAFSVVCNLRYGVLALYVIGDTGSLARGDLISKQKSLLANCKCSSYYVADTALALLFLHEKMPFLSLTKRAAQITSGYAYTFWLLGLSASLGDIVHKRLTAPEYAEQPLVQRAIGRDPVVALADWFFGAGCVASTPQVAEAAAFAGILKLWPN